MKLFLKIQPREKMLENVYRKLESLADTFKRYLSCWLASTFFSRLLFQQIIEIVKNIYRKLNIYRKFFLNLNANEQTIL